MVLKGGEYGNVASLPIIMLGRLLLRRVAVYSF